MPVFRFASLKTIKLLLSFLMNRLNSLISIRNISGSVWYSPITQNKAPLIFLFTIKTFLPLTQSTAVPNTRPSRLIQGSRLFISFLPELFTDGRQQPEVWSSALKITLVQTPRRNMLPSFSWEGFLMPKFFSCYACRNGDAFFFYHCFPSRSGILIRIMTKRVLYIFIIIKDLKLKNFLVYIYICMAQSEIHNAKHQDIYAIMIPWSFSKIYF